MRPYHVVLEGRTTMKKYTIATIRDRGRTWYFKRHAGWVAARREASTFHNVEAAEFYMERGWRPSVPVTYKEVRV